MWRSLSRFFAKNWRTSKAVNRPDSNLARSDATSPSGYAPRSSVVLRFTITTATLRADVVALAVRTTAPRLRKLLAHPN